MKSSLLLLLCAAVTFVSCDTELLTIDRDFTGAAITFDVPASDGPGTLNVGQTGIETELRQNLEDFGIAEENLRAVAVNTVDAFINDPSEMLTFDDLSDVKLLLSSATLGEVEIAELVSASGNRASFEVKDVELKDYLLSDSFDAKLSANSSEAVGEDVTATVDISYTITGGL